MMTLSRTYPGNLVMNRARGVLTFKPKATKKQQQAMAELLKRYHKTGKPILPPMPAKKEGKENGHYAGLL
ncbi:hypothetical protein FACS189445_4680 [Spirochaetia bacterium]|nr:hypothetical protein FACS189445_4680 [Spirochaetia bacterium]